MTTRTDTLFPTTPLFRSCRAVALHAPLRPMARSDAFGWPQRLRFRNRALSRTRLAPAKQSRPARQLAPKRLVRPARGCSPAASQAKASKGDGHARPDTRSEFLHASGRISLPDALL